MDTEAELLAILEDALRRGADGLRRLEPRVLVLSRRMFNLPDEDPLLLLYGEAGALLTEHGDGYRSAESTLAELETALKSFRAAQTRDRVSLIRTPLYVVGDITGLAPVPPAKRQFHGPWIGSVRRERGRLPVGAW